MQLKILSYNIHMGFAFKKKRFILDAIKHAIKILDLDLVFLQEIVGEHILYKEKVPSWPLDSQLEYLADQSWSHYAYGKNAVYDEGHHGNAVLSRYPISSYSNFDISVDSKEPRGLLHCEIALSGWNSPLHCFCTHLDLRRKARLRQFELISAFIRQSLKHQAQDSSQPFLLAGDFNDWNRKACRTFEHQLGIRDSGRAYLGGLQPTFPSLWPLFPLDRIYVCDMQVEDCRVLRGKPWSRLSDHCPIYAQVRLLT